jgi:glucosylceramidase
MNLKVVQTAKDTEYRLSLVNAATFESKDCSNTILEIDDSVAFQEIEGFGGAFTEAAAYTFYNMGEDNRETILNSYFGEDGLNYNLCRTHINSCDFSLGNYSSCEVEGDYELKSFNIERDKKYIIPFIKEAQAKNSNITFFASPWSPPAWMKTNGEMNNGGKLKDHCKEAWALFYAKYIKELRKENIDIWGITVQNEPMAKQVWDSCLYTHEEERDFVRDYLGPTLEREGLKDVNIIVWDHNRDVLYDRAKVILSDPECAKYVWGVGFHWYSGDQYYNLQKTHDEFPDKKLLFTEGCQEGGVKLGSWAVGERYGHNIIGDLNSWTVGWVDWNLVLNEKGGPNHVGNYCDAPIIADTKEDKLYFQSSYYYIGHFSKFIKKGAKRIKWMLSDDSKLETTAFKNPKGEIVVVVMNQQEEKINYKLKYKDEVYLLESLPHSIATILVQ